MGRFQDKRVWIGGGALSAIVVLATAWFMLIGPEFSSTDGLRGQTAATGTQNTILQHKVKSLQAKSTQISRFTAQLKAAFQALPYDSGLPAFTRQLSTQAKADGVDVSSVVVGGISAVVATPTAASTTAEGSDPATPPTVGTPTSAGALFAVGVTIQSNGSLAHQLQFLNDIRTAGARRALVTSAQVTPAAGAKTAGIAQASAFTTQLTVFSAPRTPAQIAQLKQMLSGKLGN